MLCVGRSGESCERRPFYIIICIWWESKFVAEGKASPFANLCHIIPSVFYSGFPAKFTNMYPYEYFVGHILGLA